MARYLVLAAASTLLGAISYAQQQPPAPDQQGMAQVQQPAPPSSLGEIARQLRWTKQQKDAQQKAKEAATNQETQVSGATAARPPAKSAHLVSNDDRSERASVTPVSTHPVSSDKADSQAESDSHQAKAETSKSEILAQKNAIAALEQDIQSLGDSIHFAGANCVANCAPME